MADARALLKARRQEIRVTHPYASYSTSGQLRCIVCSLPVKQASMWEGHLGSKAHRVNVIKMKEEEARKQQQEEEAARMEEEMQMQRATGKRKADEDDEMEDAEEAKRARLSEDEESHPPIPQRNLQPNGGGFPADFFSDPSRAPPVDADAEDEEAPETAPAKSKTQIDLEFEKFQAEILAKMNTSPDDAEPDEDRRETYERATVFAEAELVTQSDGFPARLNQGQSEAVETEPEQKEETEEEKRKRKEQEERELIMDRLLEEERAQEEADARVGHLKSRVEALKLAREARRSAGRKKAS